MLGALGAQGLDANQVRACVSGCGSMLLRVFRFKCHSDVHACLHYFDVQNVYHAITFYDMGAVN